MSVSNINDAKKRGPRKPTDDWQRGLSVTDKGVRRANLANAMHVIANHPDWADTLAYDDFAETIIKTGIIPTRPSDAPQRASETEWTETDSIRSAAWLQTEAEIQVNAQVVTQAVVAIAERRRVHPVREWLHTLAWDGTPRLDGFLSTYFGADPTPYAAAVGARWMISAVARVFEPGCKADCMIVFESPQGWRKSSGLEALCERKEWFADTPLDLGSKDGYQSIRRKWIYEIGELDSFKGRDVTKIKSFVSATSDNYRPSYGAKNRDFMRQIVFAGTTNETEYLADRTGNRRFWPVRCHRMVDIDAIRRDRAQLWAETVVRYKKGEPWYVNTLALRALCESEQEERTQADPWFPVIAQWLAAPVQDSLRCKGVTTEQVLRGALGIESSRMGRPEETRIGYVLRDLRWSSRRVSENGARVRKYYPLDDDQPGQPCPEEVGHMKGQE